MQKICGCGKKSILRQPYWQIVILLVVLLPIVMVLAIPSKVNKDFNLAAIPLKIGDWVGQDIEVPQREYDMLSPDDLLMRQYTNPKGESILLYIVVSIENREAFHPPELCYDGAGSQLFEEKTEGINLGGKKPFSEIKAHVMYIKAKDRDELVLNWYIADTMVADNFYLHQLNFVLKQIINHNSPGAMLRVSTPLVKGDMVSGMEREKRFLRELSPFLSQHLFERKGEKTTD
ncbi:MAG: EpsI family protein [Candidatus Omnitrophica bacterium]|nr:EpsI family protein [Candidatus Omnitrophota bacterium]